MNTTPAAQSVAETGKIVLAVRIDQRERGRQNFRRLVMVEHDDVETEFRGFRERLEAHRAAIDGHDEIGAFGPKLPHRLDVRAVALGDAVGDVDERLDSRAAVRYSLSSAAEQAPSTS